MFHRSPHNISHNIPHNIAHNIPTQYSPQLSHITLIIPIYPAIIPQNEVPAGLADNTNRSSTPTCEEEKELSKLVSEIR